MENIFEMFKLLLYKIRFPHLNHGIDMKCLSRPSIWLMIVHNVSIVAKLCFNILFFNQSFPLVKNIISYEKFLNYSKLLCINKPNKWFFWLVIFRLKIDFLTLNLLHSLYFVLYLYTKSFGGGDFRKPLKVKGKLPTKFNVINILKAGYFFYSTPFLGFLRI